MYLFVSPPLRWRTILCNKKHKPSEFGPRAPKPRDTPQSCDRIDFCCNQASINVFSGDYHSRVVKQTKCPRFHWHPLTQNYILPLWSPACNEFNSWKYPIMNIQLVSRAFLSGRFSSRLIFLKRLTQMSGMWLVEMVISTSHMPDIWVRRFKNNGLTTLNKPKSRESSHKIFWMQVFPLLLKQNKIQLSYNFVNIY